MKDCKQKNRQQDTQGVWKRLSVFLWGSDWWPQPRKSSAQHSPSVPSGSNPAECKALLSWAAQVSQTVLPAHWWQMWGFQHIRQFRLICLSPLLIGLFSWRISLKATFSIAKSYCGCTTVCTLHPPNTLWVTCKHKKRLLEGQRKPTVFSNLLCSYFWLRLRPLWFVPQNKPGCAQPVPSSTAVCLLPSLIMEMFDFWRSEGNRFLWLPLIFTRSGSNPVFHHLIQSIRMYKLVL